MAKSKADIQNDEPVAPPPALLLDGAPYASFADLPPEAFVSSGQTEIIIGSTEYVLQERGTPMVYRRVR